MRIFFVICVVFSIELTAQPIAYSYDSHGNRTQRSLVVSDPQSQRTVQPVAEEEKAKEVAKELGLTAFPNPAQDKVTVVIENLKEQEATVLLIDAQGKNLLNKNTSQLQNEVDMSGYKPGVYFIKVVVGKETLFYKVMKL